MKRNRVPYVGPLTPLEQTVLNRMDAGAMLAGGWHMNARFVWYLWDGDPASPQGSIVKTIHDSAIDTLKSHGLIIPNNKSTFSNAQQLSQDGKRRARYQDIARDGGTWGVAHDSEHLYVTRADPLTGWYETWKFRFVLDAGATVNGQFLRRRTLACEGGPQPVPTMATSLAWKALQTDAQLCDTVTGRKERRRIAHEAAMRKNAVADALGLNPDSDALAK